MPPAWMQGVIGVVAGASAYCGTVSVTALRGGVSSDIYRVDANGLTFCVKRALERLKVTADWHAPVERSRFEAEWMRVAASIDPRSVPTLLAEDAESGAFAMRWLDPACYPAWKDRLGAGAISVRDAHRVGSLIGRIHAATADRGDIAERFQTAALFEALRIDPYLLATAAVHVDRAVSLLALADSLRATHRVLVHGDFSPKNILIGPEGPLVLDAECATFGDAAFDLAFVLNHLLLKAAWRPRWRHRYAAAWEALVEGYRAHATWEDWNALEARTARLVSGLMLARIDGKSPVEYLSEDARAKVRAYARERLIGPHDSLAALVHDWIARQ